MKPYEGLIVLGAGGHARSVFDVAVSLGIDAICFVDINAQPGERIGTFPVVKSWDEDIPRGWFVIPAAGDNLKRKAQFEWAVHKAWPLATLVAPTATIGYGSVVGPGAFVAQHSHIGPMASVGKGCIVNTGASIEHECVIGAFTHVSVNAVVAGRSHVGELCFLGANSTVVDGISIVSNVVVGAGGCVPRSIDEPGTYVGVPARLISKKC